MNMRPLLILALAVALPLSAQEKKPVPAKPAPAKPATAKPAVDQKKIDKAKQEIRNIKGLKDAEARIKKGLKNIEAAEKEDSRLNREGLPSTEDAKAKLERLKTSSSEDDIKELENLLKDNKPALEEELRKLKQRARDRMKKDGTPATSPNPAPAPDPVPGSFDNIPAPAPLPLQKGPDFRPPPIKADRMIKGPSRDPKNPDVELPDSDQRTRTWVLTGGVTLRQPTMALDADEVDVLFKAGHSPGSNGAEKKEKPPAADSIGNAKGGDSPIERIVANRRVRFMIVDKTGRVQVGRGDHVTYEEKTGWFTIKGWPEVELGGRLMRGPSKDSVIRISRLGEADGIAGVEYLERELTIDDFPKTPDKPVPAASPIRAGSSSAPAPAPSSKPR